MFQDSCIDRGGDRVEGDSALRPPGGDTPRGSTVSGVDLKNYKLDGTLYWRSLDVSHSAQFGSCSG